MSAKIAAFDAIASDLGIIRYKDEDDNSFCRRVAYSAARPWISAFCLDDGSEGKVGLTKQGINRRLKSWVEALDDVRPGIRAWFKVDEGGLPVIYNRLIDLEDIVPNGFTNSYFAHAPQIMPVCDGSALIVGFVDTSNRDGVCGIAQKSLITSGLSTFITSDVSAPEYEPSWWETDLNYMPWDSAAAYGTLEYANLKCRGGRWSLRHSDAWSNEPELVDSITLARPTSSPTGEIQYYACRRAGGSLYLSKINRLMAQELFFYMRMRQGNRASAAYKRLDERHVLLAIPTSIVPGQYARILGSIGWPIDDATGSNTSIVTRSELLPAIKTLLERSYFSFREVKK